MRKPYPLSLHLFTLLLPIIVVSTVYSKGGHSMINLVVRLTMLVSLNRNNDEAPPAPSPASLAPLRLPMLARVYAYSWSAKSCDTFIFSFIHHHFSQGALKKLCNYVGIISSDTPFLIRLACEIHNDTL